MVLLFKMGELYTSRKGQAGISGIQQLGAFAIAIVLGAVVLGLGASILTEIEDTQTDATATTPNNESLTWAGNNTPIALGQGTNAIGGTEQVWNGTDLMEAQDYNFNASGGAIVFLNISNATWDTNALNLSYDYLTGSAARNTTGFGLSGLNTMAAFVPTVAVVAAASVVIGVILVFFGRRRLSV